MVGAEAAGVKPLSKQLFFQNLLQLDRIGRKLPDPVGQLLGRHLVLVQSPAERFLVERDLGQVAVGGCEVTKRNLGHQHDCGVERLGHLFMVKKLSRTTTYSQPHIFGQYCTRFLDQLIAPLRKCYGEMAKSDISKNFFKLEKLSLLYQSYLHRAKSWADLVVVEYLGTVPGFEKKQSTTECRKKCTIV